MTPRPAAPATTAPAGGWRGEIAALLRLGGPLIAAQLATIALTTTDVIMLGWLGAQPLAASALAQALFHPLLMFGSGVVVATAPLIAQALGARRGRDVRRSVRQGLWVAAALTALGVPLLLAAAPILRAAGQAPDLAALAASYLDYAGWALGPAMAFVVLRSFVAAHGETAVVLYATLAGVALNALGNYALIFGNFGMPRLELPGAGIATLLAHLAMTAALGAHALRARRYRRYALAARFLRADWPRFGAILTMGGPIGLMMAAETGLFSGVALLMGWIGPDALAAHAVALQLAALAFMTPLGLSHATTVRVGLAVGAGDPVAVRRAAWGALAVTLAFMSLSAALFWFAPQPLIRLFLDPADPATAAAFALAVSYLGVAAVFQLVDGAQVSAAAALRGMGDTRWPMVIAVGGYWAVGLPAAWVLAFPLGLGGVGVWSGIAVGLAVAAALLIARLATRPAR